MRTTRRIIPFALLWPAPFLRIGAPSGTRAHLAAQGEGGDNGYGLQGAGTDRHGRTTKGERHIVTRAEKDSVTGEEITSVELSEITVMARSKQVAERKGKINPILSTVPGELVSNKWQLQLAPVAY